VTGADLQRLCASLTRTTLAAISQRRATGDDEPPDPVSETQNAIVLLCNCSYAKTAEITKAVALALGEQ
jgi:hypothetical protein